jgi:drug/metabolite transporter (DMT)-like permease
MAQQESSLTALELLVVNGPCYWLWLYFGAALLLFQDRDRGAPPFHYRAWACALSALILNVWLALRRDYMPTSARSWSAFLIMGLLNNVIPFTLIGFGETRTASGPS